MRKDVSTLFGKAVVALQTATISAPVVVGSKESTRRSLGAGPASASAPSFNELHSLKAGAAPRAATRLSNDANVGENLRSAK